MAQKHFLRMDYKITYYLYQLDIGLVKMVATVKLNHENLQECQKKVLKRCILQTLVLLLI